MESKKNMTECHRKNTFQIKQNVKLFIIHGRCVWKYSVRNVVYHLLESILVSCHHHLSKCCYWLFLFYAPPHRVSTLPHHFVCVHSNSSMALHLFNRNSNFDSVRFISMNLFASCANYSFLFWKKNIPNWNCTHVFFKEQNYTKASLSLYKSIQCNENIYIVDIWLKSRSNHWNYLFQHFIDC